MGNVTCLSSQYWDLKDIICFVQLHHASIHSFIFLDLAILQYVTIYTRFNSIVSLLTLLASKTSIDSVLLHFYHKTVILCFVLSITNIENSILFETAA